jgi:N-terminal domain of molybdenum-binding protein
MYEYSMKIRVCNEKPFFGPGSVTLLYAIEKTGSLNKACESMCLSYSKGRKMLKDIIEETGEAAIEFRHGGIGGGEARITEHGKKLLKTYEEFLEEADKAVAEIFIRHYGEIDG